MVIDPWFHPFNGTVVSTRRFVAALKTRFDFRMLIAEGADDPSNEQCIGFVPADSRH